MQTIRLFCDVATYRSFSTAAIRHHITQSAASQRIGQLEKRLGVTLIDRSNRPLDLTEAGKTYLKGCRDVLLLYDRLEDQITTAFKNRPEACRIVVDAIYSAGIDLLRHLKDAFEIEHPNVTVVLDYKRPDEVYEAVRKGACDLGIVSYPERLQKVAVIPLRKETMSVVCRPQHALAGRPGIHAAQLSEWSMVSFEPSLPVGRAVQRYLRDHGADPHVSNVFDNIDTIKAYLAVNDEVAILPRRTVQREARALTLAIVPLEPKLFRPIGIIHPQAPPNGSQDRAEPLRDEAWRFVEFLLAHAGPGSDLSPPSAEPPKIDQETGVRETPARSEADPNPDEKPSLVAGARA